MGLLRSTITYVLYERQNMDEMNNKIKVKYQKRKGVREIF